MVFRLLHLLVCISLIAACTPVRDRILSSDEPEDLPQKLNNSQITRFENLIDGLGRIEQVIRLFDPENAATEWGVTDATAQSMKTALQTVHCDPKVSSALDTDASTIVQKLYSSVMSCPLVAAYELRTASTGQISLQASFAFDSALDTQNLATSNFVQSAQMSWRGRYKSSPGAGKTGRFDFNFGGSGLLKTVDGATTTVTVESISSLTQTNSLIEKKVLFTLKMIDAANGLNYRLEGQVKVSSKGDTSVYALNGENLSGERYEALQKKLGWLGGVNVVNLGR